MQKNKTVKKSTVKKTSKKVVEPKEEMVLMTSPVDRSQQFIVASELEDDKLIEAEITGQAMKHYVYTFTQDGKPVSGLSVAGVNETVRLLARNPKSGSKIRIVPTSLIISRDVVYNGEKGVEVSVYAENLISGEGAFGIKFEPYQKKSRNGSYNNSFVIEKALSKAERNAKRKLIPEKSAIEMIKKFTTQQANVRQLAPPQYQPPVNNTPVMVDYIGKLKIALFQASGKKKEMTEMQALELLLSRTGMQFNHFKDITQQQASVALVKLLNK